VPLPNVEDRRVGVQLLVIDDDAGNASGQANHRRQGTPRLGADGGVEDSRPFGSVSLGTIAMSARETDLAASVTKASLPSTVHRPAR